MNSSGADILARLRACPRSVGTGLGCRQMAGWRPPSQGKRLGMQLQQGAKAAAETPDFWLLRSGGNRDGAEGTAWGSPLPMGSQSDPPRGSALLSLHFCAQLIRGDGLLMSHLSTRKSLPCFVPAGKDPWPHSPWPSPFISHASPWALHPAGACTAPCSGLL